MTAEAYIREGAPVSVPPRPAGAEPRDIRIVATGLFWPAIVVGAGLAVGFMATFGVAITVAGFWRWVGA